MKALADWYGMELCRLAVDHCLPIDLAHEGSGPFTIAIMIACLPATALIGTGSLVSTIQTASFTLDGPTR